MNIVFTQVLLEALTEHKVLKKQNQKLNYLLI